MTNTDLEEIKLIIQEGLEDYKSKYSLEKYRDLIKEQTFTLLEQFSSMSELLEVPEISCQENEFKIIISLRAENEAQERMIELLNSEIDFSINQEDG